MLREVRLAIVCAAAVLPYAAYGQCPVVSYYRGSLRYSISRYRNREAIKFIHKWAELPVPIRSALDAHLRSKVGEAFARKLRFDEGEHFDLEKIKRISPEEFARKAPTGGYHLEFRFSDSGKGLKAFYVKIVLKDDGTVLEDSSLPDIASSVQRAHISCKEAVAIAVTQAGFPSRHVSPHFEFSPERKSFVWTVTDTTGTEPDGVIAFPGVTYRMMDIDAETGLVLRVYKGTNAF